MERRRRTHGGRALAWLMLPALLAAAPPGAAREPGARDGPHAVLRPQHAKDIGAMVCSADGRFAATMAADEPALLWDLARGHALRRFPTGALSDTAPQALALSADGRRLLLNFPPAQAVVYDTESGREERRLPTRGVEVTAVAFLPDGRSLVLGDAGGAITGYGPRGDRPRWRHSAHASAIRAVQVTADGSQVVTGSEDGSVRVTTVGGRERQRWRVPGDPVTCLAMSSDAGVVAAGYASGTLRVWCPREPSRPCYMPVPERPAPDPTRPGTFLPPAALEVVGVDVAPDGSFVVAVHDDGIVRTWDVRGTTALESEPFFLASDRRASEVPTALRLVPGGERLLVGSRGRAAVRDRRTGALLYPLGGETCSATWCTFSPGGRFLVLRAYDERRGNIVDVFDLTSGTRLHRLYGEAGIQGCAVSPDGMSVATGELDGTIRIWNAYTGDRTRDVKGDVPVLDHLVFAAHGRHVVSSSEAGVVRVADVRTGATLQTLEGHAQGLLAMQVGRGGDRLLTVSKDGTANVWDLVSGRILTSVEVHGYPQTGALSDDGAVLYVRTGDVQVGEFSATTGQLLRYLPSDADRKRGAGHAEHIVSIAVSADRRRMVTGSWDRTARIWDLTTGRQTHVLHHAADLTAVAITADASRVVTCALDQATCIWDAESGEKLCTLATFLAPPRGAAQAPSSSAPSWCVFDEEGRCDAPDPWRVEGCNWVRGLDTWSFGELAEDRVEPGLLARHVGGFAPPPPPPGPRRPTRPPRPPPAVAIQPPDAKAPRLRIQVVNQGGGIGPVSVHLNGRQIIADARDTTAAPEALTAEIEVDLTTAPNLMPGVRNTVQVHAYDAHHASRTRGAVAEFEADGEELPAPELWAVVCGVSDYQGTAIDLGFPAKDAADFAVALRLAAANEPYAAAHIQLLASPQVEGAGPGTRAALVHALEEVARQCKANDTFVLYLAGHGVLLTSAPLGYHYLLAEAETEDVSDAAVRGRVAFSDDDLEKAMRRIPANHRALFLDTCASGRVRDTLRLSNAEAHVRRLRERDGVFVLAGCAGDRLSYESSIYGQGLLTYALLQGLASGCQFADRGGVDVEILMDYARRQVPVLSVPMGLATPQSPVMARGDISFLLGTLSVAQRRSVPLATALPTLIKSRFGRERSGADALSLSPSVDSAVRRFAAEKGTATPVVFLAADWMLDGLQLVGSYRQREGTAVVSAEILRLRADDEEVVAAFEVKVPMAAERLTQAEVEHLAAEIVAKAVASLPAR